MVIFPNVHRAMQGDRIVRAAGLVGRLVFPPAALREGCDLALEIGLAGREAVEKRLTEGCIPYYIVAPIAAGSPEPLNIVKITDFGRWEMVKAANMKLTYDRKDGRIVNISGGGCPDVPYLNLQLVGKRLDEADSPRELGHTLCAMMLDVALVESLQRWREAGQAT